ncbi:nuclear transport factor 2 family protein [Agromyces sp. MMS24-JH15]|uniref:nuclear transport factor 2 family protein n=1 Tax=Agromyces sp. MMS24-JH15 TaxID=3243765 RepID=UPI00374A1619
MGETSSRNLELVQRFIRAIEGGVHGDALLEFLHPDVEQVDYPSLMNPAGGRRRLPEILAASTAGAGMIDDQRYDVRRVVESGDDLVVQVDWHGRVAQAMGDVPVGTALHSNSVISFGIDGDRIRRVEAYDCYDPLPTG